MAALLVAARLAEQAAGKGAAHQPRRELAVHHPQVVRQPGVEDGPLQVRRTALALAVFREPRREHLALRLEAVLPAHHITLAIHGLLPARGLAESPPLIHQFQRARVLVRLPDLRGRNRPALRAKGKRAPRAGVRATRVGGIVGLGRAGVRVLLGRHPRHRRGEVVHHLRLALRDLHLRGHRRRGVMRLVLQSGLSRFRGLHALCCVVKSRALEHLRHAKPLIQEAQIGLQRQPTLLLPGNLMGGRLILLVPHRCVVFRQSSMREPAALQYLAAQRLVLLVFRQRILVQDVHLREFRLHGGDAVLHVHLRLAKGKHFADLLREVAAPGGVQHADELVIRVRRGLQPFPALHLQVNREGALPKRGEQTVNAVELTLDSAEAAERGFEPRR